MFRMLIATVLAALVVTASAFADKPVPPAPTAPATTSADVALPSTQPKPFCVTGAGSGTTSIALSGSTATVTVSWNICGESVTANIHFSNGVTANGVTNASVNLSPSQCVSASADIYASIDGFEGTQTTSTVCAPASGGGGGSTPDPRLSQSINTISGNGTVGYSLSYSSEVAGPVRALTDASGNVYTCPAGSRWKVRVYVDQWKGSLIGGLSWHVQYGVCYIPNNRIVFAAAWQPFQTTSAWPLSWLSLSDTGFPTIIATYAVATFRWQGSAATCIISEGCGSTKHPGTQILFYPNNTEKISDWGG